MKIEQLNKLISKIIENVFNHFNSEVDATVNEY